MWKLFRQQGLLAKALKLSVKQLEDKQTKENEKVVMELLQAMGWDHAVRLYRMVVMRKILTSYFQIP